MFSLTSSLSSPLSADGFPSLFECFMGTMPLSDSSERAYGPYGLSLRPSVPTSRDVPEVSRFSCRKYLGVSGVYDYAGLPRDLR